MVRLDADGAETARYTRLVRPSRPIPAEATAVHGIADEDVAGAPPFAEIAEELLGLLDGAVFVAHNVAFDLPMVQHAFARAGIDYRPPAVACTLEAFRLLEPLADNHRLQSICDRRGIVLEGAHEAIGDVLATVALLRVLLDEGIAPETVELDHSAYMRLRSRGDTRPASEPQIRRVFGMARSAGLLRAGRRRRPRPGRRARRAGDGHRRRRRAHPRPGAGRVRRARRADRAAGRARARCIRIAISL